MYNRFNGQEIERVIGYTFKNKDLLRLAFTHASSKTDNYERLEFLGDSFLNYYTASVLYKQQSLSASEMSVLRSRVVSLSPLSNTIERLGLHKHIICSDYNDVVEAKGRRQNKTKSDVFESLLGAILIDGGEENARGFLERFLQGVKAERLVKDYRTLFKEEFIDKRKADVRYVYTQNDSGFYVEIVVDGVVLSSGSGRTKDLAKEQASKTALKM